MRVELLYFDGCPNWHVAADRLAEALRALGRDDVGVERRQVETAEEAEELGFLGSPSIRIDGVDPFSSGGEQVGLACRVYATPTGLGGAPAISQLLEALS
jgi:hypothetical protein